MIAAQARARNAPPAAVESSNFAKTPNMRRERHCGTRDCPSGLKSRRCKMNRTMIAVAAGALTLAAAGSASAQAIVVEGPYAAPVYEGPYNAPVYEVAPAPYYAAPLVIAPAPRVYAAPPAAYGETVIRRGPVAREVVVTQPQPVLEPAPGIIYSNW